CLFLVAAVAFERYHAKHRRQPVSSADHPDEEPFSVEVACDHHRRMLIAFVGDRDYDEALRLAQLINERYRDPFLFYSKALAEQLPRRMDDFTKLKLPPPAEWTALKK